jgi:hypothetical protein
VTRVTPQNGLTHRREEMKILLFDPHPHLRAIGLARRRMVDRYLEKNDPRRQLIARAIPYGGIFIVVAVSVWLRHH